MSNAEPLATARWPSKTAAWCTVGVLLIAYVLAYVDRLIVSLLVEPIKNELSLSDTQIGVIVGLSFALFYSLMGIPIARIADGGNRKRVLVVSAALWSMMTALCGFASGFWSLFFARVGVAVGEAGIAPTSLSIISDNFPAERRSRPISLWVFGGPLASVLAFGGGAALLVEGGAIDQLREVLDTGLSPWRIALIGLGILGIPLVLVLLMIREPIRQTENGMDQGTASVRKTLIFVRQHQSMFIYYFTGVALCFLVLNGILIWMPALLMRQYGMTLSEAGSSIAILSLVAGLLGTIGGGYLNDFVNRRGLSDGSVLATAWCAAFGFIPLALAAFVNHTTTVVIMFGVGITGMAAATTIPQIAIQQVVPNQMRAQIAAGYFFLVNIVGFGLGPVAVGAATDVLFGDEAMIGWSIQIVVLVAMPFALIMLGLARRPFREIGFSYRDAPPH